MTDAVKLRWLEIENPWYPLPAREDKIVALARLGITVRPDQSPLAAWALAMCRENDLPEELPAIHVGDAAQEACSRWLWWLA